MISLFKKIQGYLPRLSRKWNHRRVIAYLSFENGNEIISGILGVITVIAATACLISVTVYAGYNLNPHDQKLILGILRSSQIIFLLNIIFHLIYRKSKRHFGRIFVRLLVDVMVVLSVISHIAPDTANPLISVALRFFTGKMFLFISLTMYSIVDLSYALSMIPGRRTNPSIMMALSFLFFIIIGSFLLMLPRCTHHGISYIDSLFMAASAVCITGLTSVDIPSTFTPFGIIVISLLVQLGSLGLLTFTSFFATFFTGSTSVHNQLLLKDIIYSKSMNALVPTLLYVLGFTVSIEILGAVLVFFTTPDIPGLDLNGRVLFAGFHSLSSFCNAGFSCLPEGMANPYIMRSDQNIYIVTSILIFAGAVGFPILVNLREIISFHLKKFYNRLRNVKTPQLPVHLFDLNTKIVLATTSLVLIFGTCAFLFLEYDNTLKGMSLYEKIVQSVFNSLVPRSAGFSSVNPGDFLNITLFVIVVQMAIGGASQSMAGGIKVNTLGVLLLSLRAVVSGHEDATAYNRTINKASVLRAYAVLLLAVLSLFVYTSLILYLEPEIPLKSSVFEVISAVFTVGSSLGATPLLSDASKAILATAMFFGRIGFISFLCGVAASRHDVSPHLPADNVIIN